MTSKGRNQFVSHDDAKPQRDAVPSPLPGGRKPGYRGEMGTAHATQREVAGYIEGLSASLRIMAQSADLDSLAYFLEMARLEASIQGERLARSGADKGNKADC